MKRVTLVRHAKSDWENPSVHDVDRHLNERGYSDAYLAAEWFLATQSAPDLILSSTATRALNTALIFVRALNVNMNQFQLVKKLYEIKTESFIELIQQLNNTHQEVVIFGHNPATTNACNILSDELYFDNIPTCGMVCFAFEIKSWSDLKPKTGKVQYYKFPKDYKTYN